MEWQTRHLNDELWLRARRLLVARLRRLGLDSSYDEYRSYFAAQHAAGTALQAAVGRRIGAERAAELAAESFLADSNRRFRLRLPFILAFTAEYADWLSRLAPVPAARQSAVRELAALFNLGIVLVDQISDEPELRGDLAAVFGGGRLERLFAEPAAAAPELARLARDLATPELRVLAAVVAAFFAGVAELTGGRPQPELYARFVEALAAAYRGQLAADGSGGSGGGGSISALRAKSVTPFVVPPLLALLAGAVDPAERLPDLGERLGEAFWRVDDLVDVARDAAYDDGNLILSRLTGNGSNGSDGSNGSNGSNGSRGRSAEAPLAHLLETAELEAVAAEAGEHAGAALDLLTDQPAIRQEAARWLEMYVLDWLR